MNLSFSDNSCGFRPSRNAHQAIKKARQYINEGYTWVVDIDLEKYFDTVNHDKLMSLVAREVKDKRVMKSITVFIEDKLKLKVNKKKSTMGRPWERKFLGFSFYLKQKEIRIRIHPRSLKRIKEKIRFIISRSNAWSMEFHYLKLRQLVIGWVSYFRLADIKTKCQELDEWTRRRIRMCYWKQWKKIKTKCDNLRKLGIDYFNN